MPAYSDYTNTVTLTPRFNVAVTIKSDPNAYDDDEQVIFAGLMALVDEYLSTGDTLDGLIQAICENVEANNQ